jgi:hypothetical protein
MTITKFDFCKKQIRDEKHAVTLSQGVYRFGGTTLYFKCGLPVVAFMRRHKLLSDE